MAPAGAPKIQNLGFDDVGRGNAKLMAGKLPRQLTRAGPGRISSVGRWSLLSLILDIAILRTDDAGCCVGHVDAVIGSDVDRRAFRFYSGGNNLAERLLHIGELIGTFLDAGADLGGAHMLRTIRHRRGKEIPPPKRPPAGMN